MIMKRSPRTLQTKAEMKCHLANNSFKKREKITENDQNQVWSEALGGGETASGERRPHVPPAHRLILVLYFYDFSYLLFFAVLSPFFSIVFLLAPVLVIVQAPTGSTG